MVEWGNKEEEDVIVPKDLIVPIQGYVAKSGCLGAGHLIEWGAAT